MFNVIHEKQRLQEAAGRKEMERSTERKKEKVICKETGRKYNGGRN